jgi:hypothetical protein
MKSAAFLGLLCLAGCATQSGGYSSQDAAATLQALQYLYNSSRPVPVQPTQQQYQPQNYTPQILPAAPAPQQIDQACMNKCAAANFTYQWCLRTCSY